MIIILRYSLINSTVSCFDHSSYHRRAIGKVANTSMIADRVLAECVDPDLVLVLIVVVGATEPPAIEVGDEGDEGIFTVGADETVDGAFVVELGVGAPVVPTVVGLVVTVAAGAVVAPRIVGAPVVPPTIVGAPSMARVMEGALVSPLLLGLVEEDEAVPVNVGAVVSPLMLGLEEEPEPEAEPAPEGGDVLPEILGPPVEDDPDPDPPPALGDRVEPEPEAEPATEGGDVLPEILGPPVEDGPDPDPLPVLGDRVEPEPEAEPAPEGADVLPEILGPPVEDDPDPDPPPVVGAPVLEDESDTAVDGDLVEVDEGVDIIEGVGAPELDVEGVVAGDEVEDELGAVPDPEKVIFLIVS